jgi:phospholipid transport system substrate-binding protein
MAANPAGSSCSRGRTSLAGSTRRSPRPRGAAGASPIAPHHDGRAAAPDTPSPEQVITTTAAAIVEAIAARHDELAADRRKLNELVDDVLRPRFDLNTSCRLILGEHWKTATPEQRGRFVDAFCRFLVASYGHALLEFTHDTLKVLPAKDPLVGTLTSVHTTMKLTSGHIYNVDYYMRLDDRG